jgi:hypothetical protein
LIFLKKKKKVLPKSCQVHLIHQKKAMPQQQLKRRRSEKTKEDVEPLTGSATDLDCSESEHPKRVRWEESTGADDETNESEEETPTEKVRITHLCPLNLESFCAQICLTAWYIQ